MQSRRSQGHIAARHRCWRRLCASMLTLALALTACATGADRYTRGHVDAALRESAGLSLGPGDTTLPPGLALDDGVDEREAIALALWHNAAFQEALAELGLRRADLVIAGELPNPTFWVLFPIDAKKLEFALRFPFDFLWTRPGRIAAAKWDCERLSALLVQGGLDLVCAVRSAFADLRLARARLDLQRERAAVLAAVAGFASARLAAGDASDAETANARVDALRAAAELANVERDERIAGERVRAMLGDGLPTAVLIDAGVAAPTMSPVDSVESLVATAIARRPDLRSTRHAIEQAGERAGLATAELFTLTGIADANNSGRAFEIGPGVELRIPIFNQNQGARARAAAEIEQAVRRHRTVRDRVGLEVREAHARVTAARRIVASQADMQALLLGAEQQAAAAHRAGDQPILACHLAALQRLDGVQRAAEASAELQRAEAQLARSLGGTPP